MNCKSCGVDLGRPFWLRFKNILLNDNNKLKKSVQRENSITYIRYIQRQSITNLKKSEFYETSDESKVNQKKICVSDPYINSKQQTLVGIKLLHTTDYVLMSAPRMLIHST